MCMHEPIPYGRPNPKMGPSFLRFCPKQFGNQTRQPRISATPCRQNLGPGPIFRHGNAVRRCPRGVVIRAPTRPTEAVIGAAGHVTAGADTVDRRCRRRAVRSTVQSIVQSTVQSELLWIHRQPPDDLLRGKLLLVTRRIRRVERGNPRNFIGPQSRRAKPAPTLAAAGTWELPPDPAADDTAEAEVEMRAVRGAGVAVGVRRTSPLCVSVRGALLDAGPARNNCIKSPWKQPQKSR